MPLDGTKIGHNGGPPLEVVWEPIPDTSQELALDTRCHHTLYHGARGPGKTDTQLMRFRRFVGMGYGSFWRGVIFDKQYGSLEDLISKSKRWFPKFDDGCTFMLSAGALKWIWPTGEELLFRAAATKDDYFKYHGQEFPFIGWNELTKYHNADLYDAMMSVNRSSYTPEKDGWIGGTTPPGGGPPRGPDGQLPPPIPLQVFSTTNPHGPGHNWVKQRFIDPAPDGGIVTTVVNVLDPKTKTEIEVRKTQIAIFGHYSENIYLSPEYVAELESITDPGKRAAWLEGNWDITAGGAVDDLWRREVHVIPRFVVPKNLRIDRAMDWGSSDPTSVGWFVEANGEEIDMLDGTTICPAAGTIIQVGEIYFSEGIGKNKGNHTSSVKVARRIIEYEVEMMRKGWFLTQPRPGPADNNIRNVTDEDTETVEKKMNKEGIAWLPSDKGKGSRKIGLQLIRDRLEASLDGEGPGLLFTANCIASISTIPGLPRDEDDPDDVDTDAEDHAYDMVRYRVLKNRKKYASKILGGLPS